MKIAKYLQKFCWMYLCAAAVLIAAVLGTDHAVTAFVENAPIPRENIIVIDAGHGGEDGGATSCTGVLESSINLQIALRLDDLFHFLGLATVMIRTTDTAVYTQGQTLAAKKVSDLKQRVKIVNDTPNAVLVSIHQNTFSDSKYSGAQVFYAATDGSKALAEQLQNTFATTINPGSNRKCKAADGIYLMQNIARTGVLVECGFLSNTAEEALLRDGNYQKKMCCVIASVMANFLSNT